MDTSELSWIFEMFDKNGDGRITKNELNDSLEKMGIFIPGNELSRMIDKVDDIGDGCFDVDEFESLFGSITEEEDMREAFSVFDQNGDGFITVEELKSVLGSLGLEGCQMMIMRVNERVDFTEFKKMMRGGGIIDVFVYAYSFAAEWIL